MMLARRRPSGRARNARYGTMVSGLDNDPERTRRFRDVALPVLNDVYTLARYLLRNAADADDAVQECYLRALRHFDTFRGGAVKPWLFAILRNICYATYAQRAGTSLEDAADDAEPLWAEAPDNAETELLRSADVQSIRD